MTNKKNKHRHSVQRAPSVSQPIASEEELTAQCLELHELLKDRISKLRQLETGDFCFILSTKWLRDWKDYVGYDGTVGEDKKDKRYYGKRHPGKINSDIIASGYETRDYYTLPPEMKEYDYFRQIIAEKKVKDDDYLAVTQEIWYGLLQYYEGEEIRRPVRSLKGSTYYDSDLVKCDTIFVNL
jgi:hypothetical protein